MRDERHKVGEYSLGDVVEFRRGCNGDKILNGKIIYFGVDYDVDGDRDYACIETAPYDRRVVFFDYLNRVVIKAEREKDVFYQRAEEGQPQANETTHEDQSEEEEPLFV